MGCVFCASGLNGVDPQPDASARSSNSSCGCATCSPGPDGSGCRPYRRHGHGRAAREPRQPARALDIAGAQGRPGHRRPARHRSRRSACRRRSAGWPTWASSITWPSRCTPRTMSCARASCRPTTRPACRHPGGGRLLLRDDRPAGDLRIRPAAAASTTRREHARELAKLLRGRQAHVNLIPFNDVAGLPYRRPTHRGAEGVRGRRCGARASASRSASARARRSTRPAGSCGGRNCEATGWHATSGMPACRSCRNVHRRRAG